METGDHVSFISEEEQNEIERNQDLNWPITSKMNQILRAARRDKEIFRVHNVNLNKDLSISSIQVREFMNQLWDPKLIRLEKSISPKKRVKLWSS